jgi:hypothetical protein
MQRVNIQQQNKSKLNNMKKLANTLAKAIAYIYLFSFRVLAQDAPMAEQIIIRGNSFTKIQEAADGDSISIEFNDGRLFSKATNVVLVLVFDSETTRSFRIDGLGKTAYLTINKEGNDVRGNIQFKGEDNVYILDSYTGKYVFLLKPRHYLIEE